MPNAVLNSLSQLLRYGNTDFSAGLGVGEVQIAVPASAPPPGVPRFHLTADITVGIREMTPAEKSIVDADRLARAQTIAKNVVDETTQFLLTLKAELAKTTVQIQSDGTTLKSSIDLATTVTDAVNLALNDSRFLDTDERRRLRLLPANELPKP